MAQRYDSLRLLFVSEAGQGMDMPEILVVDHNALINIFERLFCEIQ